MLPCSKSHICPSGKSKCVVCCRHMFWAAPKLLSTHAIVGQANPLIHSHISNQVCTISLNIYTEVESYHLSLQSHTLGFPVTTRCAFYSKLAQIRMLDCTRALFETARHARFVYGHPSFPIEGGEGFLTSRNISTSISYHGIERSRSRL